MPARLVGDTVRDAMGATRCLTRELQSTIEIASRPEAVWEILMDFSQYPAWNPMICAAELAPGRAPEPGVELRISIALGLGPTVKGVPTRLVRVSPARELCWVGGLRGVFRGQHYFRLERLEDGTTRLVHGERFSGALVPMVVGLSRPVLTRSYARLNEALKRRCEGRAR